MNTGRYGGSADCVHLGLVLAELARYYNLPKNIWGLSTKSIKLDAQYGYEASTQTLMAYLAGADEIYSMGLLGASQILSLDKAIFDNHIARQLEYVVNPVNLDDTHLQYKLIERVGVGGEFLTQRETLRYTREEYNPVWPPYGKELLDLIHEETLEILHTHKPLNLPLGSEQALKELLQEADKALRE
jgi:trimethylamine--corrinoid protein Co-methyltransferase